MFLAHARTDVPDLHTALTESRAEVAVLMRALELLALTIEERQPLKGDPQFWIDRAMSVARTEMTTKAEGPGEDKEVSTP